ncbi:transcription factor hamlet-like [Melanaphis sacchari]|uniref:transcription factor hamlet-like n=1 Tax=Melanaphis sacchari TaxID=742174 RepID=UPI000DC13E1F|nr:transcription factor hamlet-like [Melanaphis sacchari]
MFHCEACVTSFTRHDNLRRHIKMHDSSGFKCNFCDKLFTRNDNLSRHIRIFHSGKEACSGLVIKDGNVNESQDDIPTSVMWEWDDAVNYVVCNKAHDATRVDVRLSVKDDNITISPLVFVPNNQAGISEYGSTKINIDRLSGNTIDENYKDQIKKNWAWIKEMLSLINSIEGKNEEQQKIILQDVMTIWHAIHDSHASNLEKQGESLISNSAATKPKVYVYGKQLSFPEKKRRIKKH